MTAEVLPFFSFEEYLRLDEVSEQRHEWVAGQVYLMSGGSDRHLATVQALFERIAPGGVIMLDDAARPGERLVARRWRKEWPDFDFRLLKSGTKGTLVGRRRL